MSKTGGRCAGVLYATASNRTIKITQHFPMHRLVASLPNQQRPVKRKRRKKTRIKLSSFALVKIVRYRFFTPHYQTSKTDETSRVLGF